MNMNFVNGSPVDLQNDTKFEKLASFALDGKLEKDEMNVDIASLLEKQAYADDSTYADPVNRMFSIATPIETKLSALYAEKCASLLDEDVVNRINNACKIYDLGLEVPVVNKVASVLDDAEIMNAINVFEENYVDPVEAIKAEAHEKYASATSYGNQLDVCLAARAYYATEAEDIEALENLSKIASRIEPEKMVSLIEEIDEELGLNTPHMQGLVGTPEYAVYEKVASENMVNLGKDISVPLDVIEENKDVLSSMGVELDWDGENENSLTLQIEHLPSQIKDELAASCGKVSLASEEESEDEGEEDDKVGKKNINTVNIYIKQTGKKKKEEEEHKEEEHEHNGVIEQQPYHHDYANDPSVMHSTTDLPKVNPVDIPNTAYAEGLAEHLKEKKEED